MAATPHNGADAPTYTVTVNFARGTVDGFTPLAEAITEFIQEDRVSADDDVAQVCVEALAQYCREGSLTVSMLAFLWAAVAAALQD